MKKRLFAALGLLVLLFCFSDRQGLVLSIYECQKADFQDAARQVLEQGNSAGVSCPVGVTEVSYCSYHIPVVEFQFGSWGIGSATSYWGVNYVPSGQLVGYQGIPMEHWRTEGNGTLFYEAEGDNTCYVEPLGEGWYYYDMHF